MAGKISQIPENFFNSPEVTASDAVWLMGVWFPSKESVKICKSHEGLNSEFHKALPDLHEEDIIGSPYAVYDYKPNPLLADNLKELKQFKKKLNSLGKKLILDFVPNHMSVDSPLIKKYPDLFLYKKESDAVVCKNSFLHKNGRIYYYGRDPYFDGWSDTVQWDYSHPEILTLHTKMLLKIADCCDGLRCDMAMLPLEDVFERTHGIRALPYWESLIGSVKKKYPKFKFIAEVYWNREYDLQQLGFDYTYDKTLYDRLKLNDGDGVRLHLEAGADYQDHSLRFIENHDEERAAHTFGENSFSNFALLSFLPGSILYHQGQREGRKVKVPVQLARIPEEPRDILSEHFYDRAFTTIKNRQNKKLELEIYELKSYVDDNSVKNCIVRFILNTKDKYIEVLIFNSYSHEILGALHLTESIQRLVSDSKLEELNLKDILTGETYSREKEVILRGMFIRLDAGQSHWFVFSYA